MKSCIFILADGARYDVFTELLERGDLPNISEHIIDKGVYAKATTVFPSTTGPAYSPFIIGRFPGRINLPGIRWFDRYEYSSKFFSLYRFRSYVGLEGFLMKNDIDKSSKTLFELIPNSASMMTELTRGVGKNNKTLYWGAWNKMKAHFDNSWESVDTGVRDILLKTIAQGSEFIFSAFMGIDHFSHILHPFHKKVIESYARVDFTVGEVVKTLKNLGRLDDTLIIVSSDHGLTPTHSHFDSDDFMVKQGYKTLHYPYPTVLPRWTDAEAANMISGNAMTHIYVKSPEGWGRTTTFGELNGLVDNLLEKKGVDIVAGRDESGKITIKSERGEAAAWLNGEGSIVYETKSDPFGYPPLPSTMSISESLECTRDTEYPDAILQLIQLFESPRSGDLVVSARKGYDLRARFERPEHRSSHGAIFKDHMLVPLAVNRKISREFIRTVDIFPTILAHLGIDPANELDGQSLID